jgi:hypothetical protein
VSVEFGAFSHKVIPASHEIARGSHLCWIYIDHGHHASPEEYGDLLGVDLVVFCFSAMDCLYVEGMSEDKGNAFFVAKIGYPVPGEDAFYGNDDILTKGSDGFEKGITVGFHVAMFPDFSFFIKDADIHFSCVRVDSTVVLVLIGVKSHGLPPYWYYLV